MTNIVLFGHGGSGNRGCEAIVRGTASIVKKNIKEVNLTLVSNRVAEDLDAQITGIDQYASSKVLRRYTPIWAANIVTRQFMKSDYVWHYLYKSIIESAKGSDICMSIGGDNYCYDKPIGYYYIHKQIKKLNKKLVFWGGSVEPESIDREMADDLNSFDLKIARESITYQAFLNNGIRENVHLHADPAFTLECQEVALPDGWQQEAMVGINISPMVASYGQQECLDRAVVSLVQHILDRTEFKICFIPHVLWPKKNDRQYMQKCYNQFESTDRVILLGENYNAGQTKYIISKCRLLMAARTHATIAGYSTCVPTLAIGYSVKARGIARDVLGTEKEYVLPVQKLENEKDLITAFEIIRDRETELREYLEQRMPEYIASAWAAGEHLKSLLK